MKPIHALAKKAPWRDDTKFFAALTKSLPFTLTPGFVNSYAPILECVMKPPRQSMKIGAPAPARHEGRETRRVGDRRSAARPDLRDFENMPLKQDIDDYFAREVLPHVPDAWMDRTKDKVGYEINFNRHFYRYTPPRPLEAIDADLKKAEAEIMRLLKEVTS